MTGTLLWTSEDAARATGGRCDTPWTCTGVASDSRRVGRGDLFIALQGPSFDGHDFVAAALQDGAAAAMVSHRPDGAAADNQNRCRNWAFRHGQAFFRIRKRNSLPFWLESMSS